jgi:DNA-binding NarL/FixJ family response regulator
VSNLIDSSVGAALAAACKKKSRRIRILILDRQRLSRDALGSLLGDCSDIAVVASAESVQAGAIAAGLQEIDVVVMDLAGMDDTIEAIDELKQIRPAVRALVLGTTAEASAALEALGAGVDGYLTKDDDKETLIAAIRCLATGDRYVCPGVGWRIAMNLLQAYPAQAYPAQTYPTTVAH